MGRGDLVVLTRDAPASDCPVGSNDAVGALRHHAGFVRRGTHALVLSDPDDWTATPILGTSNPWSRVLVGGKAVWVKSHFLAPPVQHD